MAQATETKIDEAIAEVGAAKAYAAAAESIALAPAAAPAKPAAAPAKAKASASVAAKPVAAAPAALAPAAKAKPAPQPKAVKAVKPVTKKAAPKKAAVKKTAKPAAKAAAKFPSLSKFKDTIMTKTNTEDFTAKVTETVAEMQDRAKVAYDKGTAAFGEIGEFAKGNVEALVASSKILAAGLQDMGKDYVADGKTALETVTADVKELAAIKSPADFFKLQGEILRRNFDAAVAVGSKRSEAFVKLAGDAYAPLSGRVSKAIEKVKQAA